MFRSMVDGTKPFKKNKALRFGIFYVLFKAWKIYLARQTYSGSKSSKPQRDLYYSALFAIGTGTLALIPQYFNSNVNHAWLLKVCLINITLMLVTIILIYFFGILLSISWKFISINTKDKRNDEPFSQPVAESIEDSAHLMRLIAKLDISLLVFLLVAIIAYSVFVFCNL